MLLRRYRPGFFTGFEQSDDNVPDWDGDPNSVRWLREKTDRLVVQPYYKDSVIMLFPPDGSWWVIGFVDAPYEEVKKTVQLECSEAPLKELAQQKLPC